jgi:hypothetical protein
MIARECGGAQSQTLAATTSLTKLFGLACLRGEENVSVLKAEMSQSVAAWQPATVDTARYQSREMRLVEKGFDFCFKMSV